MKLLIIGGGGREQALAWKLAQEERVSRIFIAPGNGGSRFINKAENVNLKTIPELLRFAQEQQIDLTVVGSEALLVEGIVDQFEAAGLRIFGPNQKTAQLEGSKRFAKDFMQRYGVKTAAYASFQDCAEALHYLQSCAYPTVIKASGLAAGKGVVICQDQAEAEATVKAIMQDKRFGTAGEEIVIEAFLEGFECSILSFCDGQHIALMQSAKDHKTIGEHNTGANTGGMGVVSPHPLMTEALLEAFQRDIAVPTLRGLQAEQMDFAGVIFFGLMINAEGVFLLEYNMRMGDPETQAVLPLLDNSLLEAMEAALARRLRPDAFHFKAQHAVCVVGASQGYPEAYENGKIIQGWDAASQEALLFAAGVKAEGEALYSNGGRVLNVVALGDDLAAARASAYHALQKVQFEGMVYRRDIGA